MEVELSGNGGLAEGSIYSLPRQEKPEGEVDPLSSNLPKWSSTYRNIQAYICYLVSYLSILRFCDSVGKYGMFIFIPYTVFIISIGVPGVLVEVMVGRFTMVNVFKGWNMCPAARGVFYCLFVGTCFILVVNYVYSIYLLKYFISSLGGHLPWESCEQKWAKENCFVRGEKSEAYAACLETNPKEYCDGMVWESSGLQYWKYYIVDQTSPLNVLLSIFLAVIAIFCSTAIIFKGIHGLEKLLNLLMYPLIVIWLLLLIVSLNVANALTGFTKLCTYEDWEKIVTPELWVSGFQDILFFVGLATLTLTYISSHGKFTDNILIDVLIINCSGPMICFLIATPVLCIISTLEDSDGATSKDELFEDFVEVFTLTSEAFLLYPYPKSLWCALYYFYCFFTTCGSQALLLLALCEGIEGLLKKTGKRFYIIMVISAISLALAVGLSYIHDALQQVKVSVVLAMNILLYTVTWQFFYGIRKFNSDYYFMMGYPVPVCIKLSWISLLLVPPIGLILQFIFKEKNSDVHVFIYYGLIFFIYLSTVIFTMILHRIQKKKCSTIFMANPDWGPDNPILKRSRDVFDKSTVTEEIMYRQELHEKPLMTPPNIYNQNIVQLE